LYEARLDPREGDERLSANKRSESDDAGRTNPPRKPSPDKNSRKQRSTDLGRALRSIYDDTLRESVPDDFSDLIGKLS
jgi:anti-sigma factor NepR-like protein